MSSANISSITSAVANSPPAAADSSTKTASFGQKKCLNPDCREQKSRKGWRLRSGEYADLCDRCACAYEEGRFCETFHSDQSGWRSCNTCRKPVHCGCIVSFYGFVLLDDGGIDCMACASSRKNFFPTSNPALPPAVFYQVPLSERLKDLSGKGWNQLAGSGPVPWRQAPSLFNSSIAYPESHPRLLYDMHRFHLSENFSLRSLEKEKIEEISQRLMNGSLKLGARDMLENGVAGTNNEEQSSLSLNIANHSSSIRDDSSSPRIGMAAVSSNSAPVTPLRTISSASVTKQYHGNLQNGVDSADVHIRGRPRADARGKSQLLPRYWPRFTDEELQQISGNSNFLITPLFEKMLSASDAGRIGRLVLPKKCAEAYFPPISQPEGLPLKVQDAKGKEWIFQFRFWPNNNSRMYVLEGVTPCIQSMQLQAGDIVTFSRLEPEGKLIMGFRKASGAHAVDQENDTSKSRNSASANGDAELADSTPWLKVDKSGYIAKDFASKSPIRKRKGSILGTKSKHFRTDSDDIMELKLTLEEAQGLLQPPPDHVPNIVVIEGFEFEEYEDAPIIGKPTILATDNKGDNTQWVQCEDCFKWHKIPADAALPSRWTCSCNSRDPERSLCSVAQEMTADQLEDLLPSCNSGANSKKLKTAKQVDCIDSLEGLETLANLAILGEGEPFSASSQVTTKHPRHRPGCSCIVCIQPPSGKGPKHKQTCTCNLCLTVKRRFKTLTMKREKKQSQRDAETSEKNSEEHLPDKLQDDELLPSSNADNCTATNNVAVLESSDDDLYKRRSSELPFKGQIDLNMQPEREEELSPGYDSGSMMRTLQDATERQQKSSNIDGDDNAEKHQMVDGARTGETVDTGFTFSSNNDEAGDRNPITKSPMSAPETEDN